MTGLMTKAAMALLAAALLAAAADPAEARSGNNGNSPTQRFMKKAKERTAGRTRQPEAGQQADEPAKESGASWFEKLFDPCAVSGDQACADETAEPDQ